MSDDGVPEYNSDDSDDSDSEAGDLERDVVATRHAHAQDPKH